MTDRCGTCKHFEPYEVEEWEAERYPGDIDWGTCQYLRNPFSSSSFYDKDDHPHSVRAYPQDASDYRAWLHVRADFGCIEHERSEP